MTFTPGLPAATPARPKWLTASAIGVIVVAVFGIFAGLMAPVGVIFSRHHPFAGMPGAPPEMTKMIEFQQKMMSGPAPTLSMVVGVVGIAVGAWAIYSAVRVLGAKPGARPTFRRTVAALGTVELASLVLGVWIQIKSYEMFGELSETLFARAPATPHGAEKWMKTFMQGSVVLGIAFALGYGLLKLGFLAWSYRYASSREVVRHLDR